MWIDLIITQRMHLPMKSLSTAFSWRRMNLADIAALAWK